MRISDWSSDVCSADLGAVGIAYLALVGRWLLPDRHSLASLLPDSAARHFLAEVLIPEDSPLLGKDLREAGFDEKRGLGVIDLIRMGLSRRSDLDRIVLAAGDRTVVRSKAGAMTGPRDEARKSDG